MIRISEDEFRREIQQLLSAQEFSKARSVVGPGRSGAIASVYASHFLSIPWLPWHQPIPPKLRPILLIDTASASGATMRKAQRATDAELTVVIYDEPPRVKFWYEK